jgi:hypothetical protein
MKRLLLAAGVLALIALWFFITGAPNDTATRIERRAGLDLVEACNEAAVAAGAPERFSVADVLPPKLEPAEGPGRVAVLVSTLEARRGGFSCRWDGIEGARLTRLAP